MWMPGAQPWVEAGKLSSYTHSYLSANHDGTVGWTGSAKQNRQHGVSSLCVARKWQGCMFVVLACFNRRMGTWQGGHIGLVCR